MGYGTNIAIIVISVFLLFVISAAAYQYSQIAVIEEEKKNLQNEKASLEQQRSDAITDAESLRSTVTQMQSAEQDYQDKIDTLTSSNSWTNGKIKSCKKAIISYCKK